MKNFYFVVMVDYTGMKDVFGNCDPEKTRLGAFVWSASESDNLVSVLEHIGGLKTANLCPTKKRAKEIADAWNESFKRNGTYAF